MFERHYIPINAASSDLRIATYEHAPLLTHFFFNIAGGASSASLGRRRSIEANPAANTQNVCLAATVQHDVSSFIHHVGQIGVLNISIVNLLSCIQA